MKRAIFVIITFVNSLSFAARLEDVTILGVKSGRDSFELKLRAKDGSPQSYFFLDIVKSDPDSFDKMVHVIKKITQGEKYKLDLDIPSFSATPSGSYYRSEGIHFYGPTDREPNATKPVKKRK